MPKVGKKDVRIRGNKLVCDVYYSRSENFSIRGLPQDVLELTKFRPANWNTEEELDTALFHALKDYHEKVQTMEKLIVYRLRGTAELIMKPEGDRGFHGMKEWVCDRFVTMANGYHDRGKGITIEWKRMIRVNGEKVQYHTVKEGPGSFGTPDDGEDLKQEKGWFLSRAEHVGNDENVIPWTPEREAFFVSIDKGMEEMAKRISSFFSADDEALLKLIDTGGKNLLGPASTEDY